MSPQKLAKMANTEILKWAKEIPKLVIGLDGYTGIGKTTLLNNLVTLNPEILPVNRDDFLFERETIKEKLSKTDDRSKVFELEVCDDKKMGDLVINFKNKDSGVYAIKAPDPITGEWSVPKDYDLSKKIMIIEGVFMFHPEAGLNKLWDKRIYLEGDIQKIDERRVKREKERWGKDYFPETHPDSYFRAVTIGLKRYIEKYKPNEIADLVLRVD